MNTDSHFRSTQNCVIELVFRSGQQYGDPFSDIELDLGFLTPSGKRLVVPAFWSGEDTWRARYASPEIGTHTYVSICSDTANRGLHGLTGKILVDEYQGENLLYSKGGIRVSEDRRFFEYWDGTPFFWLADTWWGGMCHRLKWPGEFAELTQDRVDKNYTVVQICAAFPPIMDAFDPRGENEAGLAWEEAFRSIRPGYFDLADRRIEHLVSKGLLPCVVGAWGYTLMGMGVRKMKQHWRYLVARWGAYPVTWCLAGEGSMPWYLSETKEQDRGRLSDEWSEVGRYLKEVDPFDRLVTYHPTSRDGSGKRTIDDVSVMDFDMLQTGHWLYDEKEGGPPYLIDTVRASRDTEPRMPVVNAEPMYEGVFGAGSAELQRFQFWACVLSGVAGFTYGAAGIWEVNTDTVEAGVSPGGVNWGTVPWNVAYKLPGATQVGLGKRLLDRYPWWRLEPHQEWVEPHWEGQRSFLPFAAGIPGELRIFYVLPQRHVPVVKQLEKTIEYRALWLNPINGTKHEIGVAKGDEEAQWQIPKPPIMQDWVLVLEAV